jgi:hypothetical protein
MDVIQLKGGSQIYFGEPANPMPRALSDSIAALMRTTPGVAEAHLPQCYIEGAKTANQILAVVPHPDVDLKHLLDAIGRGLTSIIPSGQSLDVLPLAAGAPELETIRSVGCKLDGAVSDA